MRLRSLASAPLTAGCVMPTAAPARVKLRSVSTASSTTTRFRSMLLRSFIPATPMCRCHDPRAANAYSRSGP